MVDFSDVVGWGIDNVEETIGPAGSRIIAIAAGSSESLALRSDGTLIAWGTSQITDSPYIEPCPVGSGYQSIAIAKVTENTCLAIKADGSIAQWGDYTTRWGAASPPAGTDFIAVSAGWGHGMALHADGTVECWGDNSEGQCAVPAGTYTAISAGESFSVGLKTDGSIICWGRNTNGECDSPAGTDYTAISAGYRHSIAIKADGTLVGWGKNDAGQTDCPTGTSFVAISAGNEFSVALRSNGSMICWGYGYSPNVTSPDAAYQPYVAVAVTGSGYCFALVALDSGGYLWGEHSGIAWGNPNSLVYTGLTAENLLVAIVAGREHGVALKSDATVVAWGDNTKGQCTVPSPNEDFALIAAGSYHSLALKTDMRTVISWGDDTYNQVTDTPNATLLKSAIAGGGGHSLAIHDLGSGYGSLLAWGNDSSGQCSEKPSSSDFKAVAAGSLFSVGLKTDGSIECWGDNSYGQVSDCPVGTGFLAIACGSRHALAVKSDHSIVGWGDNSYNQIDCPTGTDWVEVAAGGDTSAARKSADAPTYGESISWGWMPPSSQYPKGKNFKAVSAGYGHGLAIKKISTPKAVYFDTTAKKQMAVRCAKCLDIPSYDTIDITFSGITLRDGQSWPTYLGLPSNPNRKFTVPKCIPILFSDADVLWAWGNVPNYAPTDPDFKGWAIYFKYGTNWDAEFGDWRVQDCGQLLLFEGGGSSVAFEARSYLKDPYGTGRLRQGQSVIDLNSRAPTKLPGEKRKFRNIISVNVANTLQSTDAVYQSTGVFTFNGVSSFGGSALIEGGGLFEDQL
jgi:alpha-tubulin suppressor-like RCC1 family protein